VIDFTLGDVSASQDFRSPSMRFTSLVLPSAAMLVAAAVSLPSAADIAAVATAFAEPSAVALRSDRLRDGAFTVSGIEAMAGLEPIVPTALVAGPTLAENSDVVGPRLALTRRDAGIPEPETYALMIAGLAAIGVVRRRRPPGTA
jgi:hypothetical protein